jgi:hypothetical protein
VRFWTKQGIKTPLCTRAIPCQVQSSMGSQCNDRAKMFIPEKCAPVINSFTLAFGRRPLHKKNSAWCCRLRLATLLGPAQPSKQSVKPFEIPAATTGTRVNAGSLSSSFLFEFIDTLLRLACSRQPYVTSCTSGSIYIY